MAYHLSAPAADFRAPESKCLSHDAPQEKTSFSPLFPLASVFLSPGSFLLLFQTPPWSRQL